MTNYLYRVYLEENQSWLDVLQLHKTELPEMNNVLLRLLSKTEMAIGLHGQMKELLMHMQQQMLLIDDISLKIQTQQKYFNELISGGNEKGSDPNVIYEQEEIRDRVLAFETDYLDTKHLFQQHTLRLL